MISLAILAADSVNPWVPAGLAGFSFIAVLGLLWKIQKGYVSVQDHRIALCALETREAKLETSLSEWRMTQLVNHLRREGILVPDVTGQPPPDHLREQQDRLSQERQRLDA